MFKMNKPNSRILLALLAFFSASLACSSVSRPNIKASGMVCSDLSSPDETGQPKKFWYLDDNPDENDDHEWHTWSCVYTCDNANAEIEATIKGNELIGQDTKENLERECALNYPTLYSTVTPTEPTPTRTLTPEPTATQLPSVPAPLLTGEVPYCDPANRVLSFRFVDGITPEHYAHTVTMGGAEMQCEVNASNKSLLLCVYPAGVTFPAGIQVTQGDQIINEFQYDGSACFVPEKPKDDPETSPCDAVPMPEGC